MGDQRVVTTIGDLGALEKCVPQFRRKVVRPRKRVVFDDLDCMLGIGGTDLGPSDGGIIVPMLQPPQGPALAIPDKKKPGAGNPRPAVPRKEAWKLGGGKYILQRGDTFFGLAATYLGAGPRWPEIRKIQPDDWKKRNPDPNLIREGDVLLMPEEAQATARKLGVLPGVLGLSPKRAALAAAGVLLAGVGSYLFGANS